MFFLSEEAQLFLLEKALNVTVVFSSAPGLIPGTE